MSTKTTKYVVEIRPNFTCKEGRAILKQLNSGITVSGNVLIARDGNSTQYIAYLDEIDPAKKIGFVDGNIFDENNNAYPGQKIEEIINSNYAGTIGVVTAVDKFNVVLTVSTTTVAKVTKKSANVSDEITSIVNDLVLKVLWMTLLQWYLNNIGNTQNQQNVLIQSTSTLIGKMENLVCLMQR